MTTSHSTMTTRGQRLMGLKEASSLDTTETAPVSPVPVKLVRAAPSHNIKSDCATISDRVRLNGATSEEDDISESSSGAVFIKLQPCILRCTSDPTPQAVTWELQGTDPIQDAFYYRSSEVLADAKSLQAEVVLESHLLGQDDAPLQMSCSLIPCVMLNGATPSDPSKPSRKTDMIVGHSTQESPACDVKSELPDNETFSPKTQDIVNTSVHNMISDSLEKSIKDVIKTTILKKCLLHEKSRQSIPCAPQIHTDSTADDVNSESCRNTPANHLKDTATDSDIKTSLVQVVGQTDQQSVSDKQSSSTSSSEVVHSWQTQEIVTMSVQDMTDSTEATSELVESVSMDGSKSPDGEVSKQSSPEFDKTTQFMITLPLENSLLWQKQETMECISKEVQEVVPVHIAFNPVSPLLTTETYLTEKSVISCTNQAAFKDLIAVSPREGKLTHPVVPQEIPVSHTRFSQEPNLTTSNSQSHQTFSETLVSSVACNPICPDKRKLIDQNNNFTEPPQKQFCLNSRGTASISHPVLIQELTMPPLLQGHPQGSTPPVLPHFAQQGDTLPILRSKLQPGNVFLNTVHSPPNYCRPTTSTNAPCFNASRVEHVNPNINFPGVPISQCQPLKSNCQLLGLQSDCIQVENSAYNWPKYPAWTQGPKMSTHPQISRESQVTFRKRPTVSQLPSPQAMTNAPPLTPMDSLRFPLPEIYLPADNFCRMPMTVQHQERPTPSLPPVSYFSSLRPPNELQHLASLASDSISNFHQDKLRVSAAVDRNQILQCIRRPPPPYQARPVLPNYQDPHTIKHLPRRASADLDQWRTGRHLQPSPRTVSIPAPNRESELDKMQVYSPENYKKVSCLNCAGTIPIDDRCRVLKSDVVAVLGNAIDLSLPPTAEKPSIALCRCCEEVIHTICSSRQALTRAKEKFISYTSPEGYLKKKTYSSVEQDFCVNCNVMMNSKARRVLLFNQKNDKWIAANVIESEFNISLAPEMKHRKLYLCRGCYNKIKQIRSAQVVLSMAMTDFNQRMSPASYMFMFSKQFQGTSILT